VRGDKADMPSGVPSREQYDSVVGSELFDQLEAFSNEFLKTHPGVQESYGWVRDPLHQWSRQWEYPFVYQNVRIALADRSVGARVLDAGSGATFFPYLIGEVEPDASVTCCDYDSSLTAIFDRVNAARGQQRSVEFHQADLRRLPFDENSFDVVYCISVLEHTDSYPQILDEFRRVLRPGGMLINTFDIGLDGVSDIPPDEAERLLDCLASKFDPWVPGSVGRMIGPGSISSRELGARNPELLPWQYPLLSWLKAVVKQRSMPRGIGKNLSVFCAAYRNI